MVLGKSYAVKFLGRSGIIYSEDKRNLSLFSEMLVDDEYDLAIYLSQASQWEDGTTVSDEDRARIKANLTQELQPSRIDWC
jgi:nicotinamide riboside kinase